MTTDGKKLKKLVALDSFNCTLMSFSVSKNWIFYVDLEKGLYKMKLDGTSKKCIKKGINFQECQVLNDWIYYDDGDNLFMIKSNEKKEKIASEVLTYSVEDGYIYYSVRERGTYKIKTDLSEKKKLTKYVANTINVIDNTIYFTHIDDHATYRMRIGTNGKKLKYDWYND